MEDLLQGSNGLDRDGFPALAWQQMWPVEWFMDRDGFPALARQQMWGSQAVEHVIARMVDAGSKIDGESTFGDVVGVEGLHGGERYSLTVCELDQHSGAEG